VANLQLPFIGVHRWFQSRCCSFVVFVVFVFQQLLLLPFPFARRVRRDSAVEVVAVPLPAGVR
jgi:hypothetical protein